MYVQLTACTLITPHITLVALRITSHVLVEKTARNHTLLFEDWMNLQVSHVLTKLVIHDSLLR